MKKLALIIIVILLLALFLGADIYTKSMERVMAFELMGKKQSEKVEIRERWMGKNKFAQHAKDMSIIVDYDKEKLFFIVHPQRMYIELPTDFNREKLMNLLLGLSPKAAEVLKSIKITDVKVNLEGESKKIANWDCTSTDFEMTIMIPALNILPKFKMTLWTTKDLSFEYEEYTKVADEFFVKYILGMINIDEESQKEMAKMETVDGFQIAADLIINIFGSEIHVEAQSLEVTEKPAPPGTYSVPKGYKKKTIDSLKKEPSPNHLDSF
jgi:hypothetical protein